MKVLFVIHYPVFGGPHNQALQLAGALRERGWDMLVVLPDEPGNAAVRLRKRGIEVIQMPLSRLRASPDPRHHLRLLTGFASQVQAIRHVITERRVDLVLVGGLPNPHAAVAASLEKVPVVWQILDTRVPRMLRPMLMPLVLSLADAVMTTGGRVAGQYPGAFRLGERLVPFCPPVDTDEFRPDQKRRVTARVELGIPEDALLIGTVGNLNPQKGHEYLVRSAARVLRTFPDTHVRILGAHTPTHARYEARLREESAALGLIQGGRLRFQDPGARVAQLLPAFDVFLLTSVPQSEGIPTVILEAMACGVPVVAADVGGVREVLEDGVTGLIVPPLDPDAVALATARLLADPRLRHRMGKAGRERAVANWGISSCVETHLHAFEVAMRHHRARHRRHLLATRPSPPCSFSENDLHRLLVCPACYGELSWSPDNIQCEGCGRRFPLVDGIPVMLLDATHAHHDELDHMHGDDHKFQQVSFFDRRVAEEFEITRPHGTPALYRWMLAEKYRRSIRGLESLVPGATVLTVCGGSGMDGEFLARSGARVISSDISLGAARRAHERARRYGLPMTSIVADVEHLPFSDQAVDLVYVHDGLHHLEKPQKAVAEMARVAFRAVSITEPARARATTIAVRLGWALEREEAGNLIVRLSPAELQALLSGHGFNTLHHRRYIMYYRHEPGSVMRLLSRPGLYQMSQATLLLANTLVGRWGNKLSITALRRDEAG